jgi:hypothetical protein
MGRDGEKVTWVGSSIIVDGLLVVTTGATVVDVGFWVVSFVVGSSVLSVGLEVDIGTTTVVGLEVVRDGFIGGAVTIDGGVVELGISVLFAVVMSVALTEGGTVSTDEGLSVNIEMGIKVTSGIGTTVFTVGTPVTKSEVGMAVVVIVGNAVIDGKGVAVGTNVAGRIGTAVRVGKAVRVGIAVSVGIIVDEEGALKMGVGVVGTDGKTVGEAVLLDGDGLAVGEVAIDIGILVVASGADNGANVFDVGIRVKSIAVGSLVGFSRGAAMIGGIVELEISVGLSVLLTGVLVVTLTVGDVVPNDEGMSVAIGNKNDVGIEVATRG